MKAACYPFGQSPRFILADPFLSVSVHKILRELLLSASEISSTWRAVRVRVAFSLRPFNSTNIRRHVALLQFKHVIQRLRHRHTWGDARNMLVQLRCESRGNCCCTQLRSFLEFVETGIKHLEATPRRGVVLYATQSHSYDFLRPVSRGRELGNDTGSKIHVNKVSNDSSNGSRLGPDSLFDLMHPIGSRTAG